jgi:phage shock protein E
MVKKLSVFALYLSLVGPGCVPEGGAQVTSGEAHQLVAQGAVLVDVRTPEEFAGGHLDGARNVPVDELAGRMGELPRDRVLVVYCRSGARSSRAAAMLRGAGYQARDLGPMSAW